MPTLLVCEWKGGRKLHHRRLSKWRPYTALWTICKRAWVQKTISSEVKHNGKQNKIYEQGHKWPCKREKSTDGNCHQGIAIKIIL